MEEDDKFLLDLAIKTGLIDDPLTLCEGEKFIEHFEIKPGGDKDWIEAKILFFHYKNWREEQRMPVLGKNKLFRQLRVHFNYKWLPYPENAFCFQIVSDKIDQSYDVRMRIRNMVHEKRRKTKEKRFMREAYKAGRDPVSWISARRKPKE